MQSKRTLFLIEVAMFTAFAFVLDLLPFLKFKVWPQGGSISFAMIPLFIIAFRWGIKGGLLSGFLYGVLQWTLGTPYVLHPVQAVLDYGVAFTVIGFAGVFAPYVQQALKQAKTKKFITLVILGVFLGAGLRFVAHYLAGVIFFGSSIDGMNAWVFSLIYNGSFMLPVAIINIVAVSLLFHKRPKLIEAYDKKIA